MSSPYLKPINGFPEPLPVSSLGPCSATSDSNGVLSEGVSLRSMRRMYNFSLAIAFRCLITQCHSQSRFFTHSTTKTRPTALRDGHRFSTSELPI